MGAQTVEETTIFRDERLEVLMQRRLGNRVQDIRVYRESDGIVLQGRTTTYYAKQLAQHAAMELSDVPITSNNIDVC